jgi:small-conductance mechanosensitive channel
LNELYRTIADYLGASVGFVENAAATIFVVLALWLLRSITLRIVSRQTDDSRIRYTWSKGTRYIVYIIGILWIGRIWFEGIASLATYLGLLSAGLAVALKDPIASIAGWVFILARRPFEVGDRIQIGEHSGDVIDQRIFQFTILEIGNWVDADQSTGRIIHIPNGKVFIEDVANYTKAFSYIWDEMKVLITFESDWKRAKQILSEIVNRQDDLQDGARQRIREASSKYMIFYNKLTPKVYTSVEASGVSLQVRYLTEPRRRRARKEDLWEAILNAFVVEEAIDFAYPTQRITLDDDVQQGKREATEVDPI